MKPKILKICPAVEQGQIKEPSLEDYQLNRSLKLGAGAFGQVYKVVHKETKQVFALKIIQKDLLGNLSAKTSNNFVDILNREIEIMYSLNHPYIVKLYCHFEDDENCYLVIEFCPNGQLYSYLQKRGKLDSRTSAQYVRELASALDYLHSRNPPIIHRDIKPENVLLDSEFRVKLCDFGWSNVFKENVTRFTYAGTPDYLAPEMILRQGHDCSLDI